MSEMKPAPLRRRRGLVLQGGGGKGAYQAGCLVALQEAGIEFDAVAGTSVGALNAAAWSAKRLDAAREFWLRLSPGKVLKWRRPIVFWGPLQAAYAFVFWPGIAVEKAYGPPSTHWPTATYGLLTVVLLCALVPPAIFLAALEWVGYKNEVVNRVGGAYLLLVIALFATQFLRGVLIAVARRLRLALFTTALLERAIDTVIGPATVSIPTFVTLARRVPWFDPDEPYILLSRSVRVIGFPIGAAFIPRYERIDGKPREEVSQLLVGTASLPEGIFPALRLDGEEYVDGGAADNTPVYPLIEFEPCDEIWILTLTKPEKKGQSARTRYLREWKFIERRLRVSAMGVDMCKKLFHRYVHEDGLYTAYTLPRVPRPLVPEREPNHWPARIVEIAPRSPLGGFLSGTLNFRQTYVLRLFNQGYAGGRDAVAKYLQGET